MKTTKFTDENNVEWDITITYIPEHMTHELNTTGNESVRVKSINQELDITYPFIPIGLKFRITPTTTTDGVKTYGYLSYDGELVCSFDPEL
jgi:hypothetical protein